MTEQLLIVDDSDGARQMVARALQPLNCELLFANDGLEALSRLSENPDVRLVICDVQMPRMSGVEFLRVIRAKSEFDSLSVVMLTTAASGALLRQAAEQGVTVWVMKPFTPENLVATVSKLLQ